MHYVKHVFCSEETNCWIPAKPERTLWVLYVIIFRFRGQVIQVGASEVRLKYVQSTVQINSLHLQLSVVRVSIPSLWGDSNCQKPLPNWKWKMLLFCHCMLWIILNMLHNSNEIPKVCVIPYVQSSNSPHAAGKTMLWKKMGVCLHYLKDHAPNLSVQSAKLRWYKQTYLNLICYQVLYLANLTVF